MAEFLIVKFLSTEQQEEEVGIVHKNWTIEVGNVEEGNLNIKCYWPPYWKTTSKLKKAIESAEEPNPSSWKLYDIKIMHSYRKFVCNRQFKC